MNELTHNIIPVECTYDLNIDPRLFREQREMLLMFQIELLEKLQNAEDKDKASIDVVGKHKELINGLIKLTDSIADQAHDKHGLPTLLIGNN